MKNVKLVAASVVSGVVLAGSVVSPVFAWHPKGAITKYVQNQSTNGQLSDANDDASAVKAKPGDVLKYVIEVRNEAGSASNNYNDMAFTVLTDALPDGVVLVSNPSERNISVNLGTLKPGQKVTKEYLVKVTAETETTITNKACFTGDSEVRDNPQQGCDDAKVKVEVPVTPTPEPEEPARGGEEQPTEELPAAGPADMIMIGGLISLTGYAGYMLHLKRKMIRQ